MGYTWQFGSVFQNVDLLAGGLRVTLALTLASVMLGTLIAVPLAGARTSSVRPLRLAAATFIEVFRGLPVLALLVWLYYCLPLLAGSTFRISSFWIATVGLGLNFSALESEILRAGYDAIPSAEVDAARFLHLTALQTARHITLPQAFWRSLAPTLGQVVNTVKLSSLASFITVPELFYVNEALVRDTFRPLEFYTALALCYLALIVPASLCVQVAEARLRVRFRADA